MARSLLGIVSDTHDNKWALEAILGRFKEEDVTMVVHAGDYVAPFNARCFSILSCEFVGIFGNNDGERVGLTKSFAKYGPLHVGPHPITIGTRRLLVMHEPAALDALGKSGEFDALIYGHTHALDIRTLPHAAGDGQTLIINPGEGGGWLHDRATAVLLDLDTMKHEVVEVPHYPH